MINISQAVELELLLTSSSTVLMSCPTRASSSPTALKVKTYKVTPQGSLCFTSIRKRNMEYKLYEQKHSAVYVSGIWRKNSTSLGGYRRKTSKNVEGYLKADKLDYL
jgi:hypothetical protein